MYPNVAVTAELSMVISLSGNVKKVLSIQVAAKFVYVKRIPEFNVEVLLMS